MALPADQFRRRCVQTRQNPLHCHFIRLPSAPRSSLLLTSYLFCSSRAGWQRFCYAVTPYAEESRASFAILQPLEHPARGIQFSLRGCCQEQTQRCCLQNPPASTRSRPAFCLSTMWEPLSSSQTSALCDVNYNMISCSVFPPSTHPSRSWPFPASTEINKTSPSLARRRPATAPACQPCRPTSQVMLGAVRGAFVIRAHHYHHHR